MNNVEKNLLLIACILLITVFLFGCGHRQGHKGTDNTEYIEHTPDLPDDADETPEDPVEENPDHCDRDLDSDHICKTKLIGFKDGLDDNDRAALETAKQRCQVYFPDSPCLKKFIKKSNQTYHAICGKDH